MLRFELIEPQLFRFVGFPQARDVLLHGLYPAGEFLGVLDLLLVPVAQLLDPQQPHGDAALDIWVVVIGLIDNIKKRGDKGKVTTLNF